MTSSEKKEKEETIENSNEEQTQEKELLEEMGSDESTEALTEKEISAEEIKKLEDQLAVEKDKYTRLFAEFDNFRRRTAKEKLELIKSANEKLCISLLPIADDFERAINSYKEDVNVDTIKEGTDLIFNKFSKSLEKANVKPIEVAQGDALDTELHEAITQIPAPSPELSGKIIDVVEKGYTIEEKVIRYAKVVVGA